MGRLRAELVYQRWLEVGLPEGVAGGTAAMWAWPVGLAEGRAMLTLLYRPLGEPGKPRVMRTQILELAADGEARVWGPGVGYPPPHAPVIFYANGREELFGLDLVKRGKVFVCRADGKHCWDWEATIRMETMIAPTNLVQVGETVFWTAADGKRMAVDVGTGKAENVRAVEAEAGLKEAGGEVRFPLTHWLRDGSLYVVDFEALGRVTKYRVG